MAKLAVPPVDPELRRHMLTVLAGRRLCNDALWEKSILPLFLARLDAIATLVRQATTTNANTPSTAVVDDIYTTLARISRHTRRNFARAAPFTVVRLAELLVAYDRSGYTLASVGHAQKYVAALCQCAVVQSPEVAAGDETPAVSEARKRLRDEATREDYEQHDLPRNVRFVLLPWAELAEQLEDEGAQKRVCCERDSKPSQLLSPLPMKLDDSELVAGYYDEYKVDRAERPNEEVLF